MTLGSYPVFPLRNPCFPGHKIPLRVFEDRYIQMLKDIADKPFFVISMISSGDEVGGGATPYRVGTLVEFEAIDRQGDFQLIRPKGRQRVYLDRLDRESKPYLTASCSAYGDDAEAAGSSDGPDRLPELEMTILKMVTVLGPEESRGIRDVMEGVRIDMDRENFSLFLCGCLHLPPIYLQRLLESRSLPYRIENALNLLSQRE
ncbi:MAG TPA: LON peptidase substrate-binding domain-containing protein [Fibrobacteria bacterium]|nr:LON peptidase substrate-binding domain-containing protein [Fibrobacteria bacterium]